MTFLKCRGIKKQLVSILLIANLSPFEWESHEHFPGQAKHFPFLIEAQPCFWSPDIPHGSWQVNIQALQLVMLWLITFVSCGWTVFFILWLRFALMLPLIFIISVVMHSIFVSLSNPVSIWTRRMSNIWWSVSLSSRTCLVRVKLAGGTLATC